MIFDCFTFSDELDLLELRLRTLERAVDRFVLCEAPFTFRGVAKPLSFATSGERFAPWRSKIVPLVYPGPPSDDPWENEFAQRNFLANGIARCSPDDLIVLSDCDEIPDPANVARRPRSKLIVGHRQRHSVGYANRIWPEPWVGTRAILWRDLPHYGTLNQLRMRPYEELEIVDGGWHLSSFGGAEALHRKMKSYAHSEYDIPYFCDRRRLDVTIASDLEVRWIALDDSFPRPLRDDARWSRYIWTKPGLADPKRTPALEHAHGCFAYVPPDAPVVATLAAEPLGWEEAGSERFGAAYAGVASDVTALPQRLGPGAWIVIDGLESQTPAVLATIAARGAAVVAYARNARSYRAFEDVLGGGRSWHGHALGAPEYRAELTACWELETLDRIQTRGLFTPWSKMPQRLSNVGIGDFHFPQIGREALADFLAQAFILRFSPRRRASDGTP